MRTLILLFLIFISISAQVAAKSVIGTLEGVVVKVSDGDTIAADINGTKLKIRLYGIDAPETPKLNKKKGIVSVPGQPYGEQARDALSEKVLRQRVKIEVIDTDRYRRSVSIVTFKGRNINEEMIKEGFAWAYREYLGTPYASEFIGLEEEARRAKCGIWKDNNPLPPWEFRKQLKRRRNGNTR